METWLSDTRPPRQKLLTKQKRAGNSDDLAVDKPTAPGLVLALDGSIGSARLELVQQDTQRATRKRFEWDFVKKPRSSE